MKIDKDTTEIEIDTTGGSFLEIVMIQLNKVVLHTNCEFRGGYYSKEQMDNGEIKLIYIPDTREIFINSLFTLALLLKPKFDKDMEEHFKEHNVKVKEIEKAFLDASSPDEEVILGEAFYDSTEDKILLETYKNKKLILFLKLFARISEYMSRKNYFEMAGGIF